MELQSDVKLAAFYLLNAWFQSTNVSHAGTKGVKESACHAVLW